jgi:glucosamine--fructose-6-phosphate aminotransferase (isomerizing)
MNNTELKYTKYALVKEMLETADVIRKFNPSAVKPFADKASAKKGLFMTGEGSSRIFPAKHSIANNLRMAQQIMISTEGSTQSMEYDLSDFAVFAASNSGQTKEVIRLVLSLLDRKHNAIFGLTANHGTKLGELAKDTYILGCGKENAVAATKSVVEQGLFYDALLRQMTGREMKGLADLASKVEEAMTTQPHADIIDAMRKADVIYFAGRSNGVAEELALKTNEITRKKSAFLEGTFAVHGIEEVMDKNEVLVWIDPFASEEEKFRQCLVDGVGMKIFTISSGKTSFPGMLIPDAGEYSGYVQLAAGWNLLVETGLALGIDLDKPVRARKVGNEYMGG